eukprot:403336737
MKLQQLKSAQVHSINQKQTSSNEKQKQDVQFKLLQKYYSKQSNITNIVPEPAEQQNTKSPKTEEIQVKHSRNKSEYIGKGQTDNQMKNKANNNGLNFNDVLNLGIYDKRQSAGNIKTENQLLQIFEGQSQNHLQAQDNAQNSKQTSHQINKQLINVQMINTSAHPRNSKQIFNSGYQKVIGSSKVQGNNQFQTGDNESLLKESSRMNFVKQMSMSKGYINDFKMFQMDTNQSEQSPLNSNSISTYRNNYLMMNHINPQTALLTPTSMMNVDSQQKQFTNRAYQFQQRMLKKSSFLKINESVLQNQNIKDKTQKNNLSVIESSGVNNTQFLNSYRSNNSNQKQNNQLNFMFGNIQEPYSATYIPNKKYKLQSQKRTPKLLIDTTGQSNFKHTTNNSNENANMLTQLIEQQLKQDKNVSANQQIQEILRAQLKSKQEGTNPLNQDLLDLNQLQNSVGKNSILNIPQSADSSFRKKTIIKTFANSPQKLQVLAANKLFFNLNESQLENDNNQLYQNLNIQQQSSCQSKKQSKTILNKIVDQVSMHQLLEKQNSPIIMLNSQQNSKNFNFLQDQIVNEIQSLNDDEGKVAIENEDDLVDDTLDINSNSIRRSRYF